jgi:hypothetical protein
MLNALNTEVSYKNVAKCLAMERISIDCCHSNMVDCWFSFKYKISR